MFEVLESINIVVIIKTIFIIWCILKTMELLVSEILEPEATSSRNPMSEEILRKCEGAKGKRSDGKEDGDGTINDGAWAWFIFDRLF